MGFLSNIFDSSNVPISVTNLFGALAGTHKQLAGLPLGTSDGSTTGEVVVKVAMIAGALPTTYIPSNGTPVFKAVSVTASPTALPSGAGKLVEIANSSSVILNVDRGSGAVYALQPSTAKVFHTTTNASELRVSLASGSATISIEIWG